METIHPDVEFVAPGDQQAIRSRARGRTWMETDAFESRVVEPLDFRIAGNKVLVHARTKIRGAGSGIEADFLFWAFWTYDDAGLQTRAEVYLDHEEAEARKAAGLSE